MSSLSATARLQKLFRRRLCWQVTDLAQSIGYAVISVRRYLKDLGYFRSYTHNGKWYTLRSTPKFDRHGVWRHTGIGFSKHGSLTSTIGFLVTNSPTGLSAREVAPILGQPYRSVLTHLHKAGALDRVKLSGEFRYLSTSAEINGQQRLLASAAHPANGPLRTHAAVQVLVEHINRPELSFEQLAASVSGRVGLSVTAEDIRRFFQEQGLKKTPGI